LRRVLLIFVVGAILGYGVVSHILQSRPNCLPSAEGGVSVENCLPSAEPDGACLPFSEIQKLMRAKPDKPEEEEKI